MTTFDPPICPGCGANRVRQHGECWLCGVDPKEYAQPGKSPSNPASRDLSFSLSSLMLVMTLVAICLGISAEAPGVGIIICILMVPALLHTIKAVQRRKAEGEEVTAASKIGLLLGSAVLTAIILAIVGVAAFCTLCGVCLTVISVGGGQFRGLLPGILFCTIGVAAIALLILIRRKLAD